MVALFLGAPVSRIASIDFFGTAGIDLQKVRSALPVRSDDAIHEDHSSRIRDQINASLDRTIGHAATDVQFVCCDSRGSVSVFIGLGGNNTKAISFDPAPPGSNCLPTDAIELYENALTALAEAIQSGKSGEDDSHGYSLSEDPALRTKQVAMRQYAITREQGLLNALRRCGSAESRQAAAEMLGYGRHSTTQIDTLVQASRDPDDGVRDNAVRALWVLANSSPKILPRSRQAASSKC